MTKQFKPQLAAKVKADEKKGETFLQKMTEFIEKDCTWPKLASPKIDGIRGIKIDDKVKSRKLIDIPSKHVQAVLAGECQGLDGELIVGDATHVDAYTTSYSGTMSENKVVDFTFWVFDIVPEFSGWRPDTPFSTRFAHISSKQEQGLLGANVKVVPHILVNNAAELIAFEEKCVAEGYEGAMVRDPNGHYKYGRSTLKEQGLVKVIRVEDGEYEIVGFNERMHNENEKTTDNLGRSKRSSHAENKTGLGDLGSFICKMPDGSTFKANGKMNGKFRKWAWENRDKLVGEFAKVQHRPYGGYDAPRFPVFLGLRSQIDMGEIE